MSTDMKQIIHFITGLAICCAGLTSCSEDVFFETEGQGNNSVGSETDTTQVPEGYMRVSFVPEGMTQTRANHKGPGTDIFHVQYFLYNNDGSLNRNDVVLDKMPTVDPNQAPVWPLEEGKRTLTLKRGATYRIVYLANVATPKTIESESSSTAGLLSGTDTYATARITAPENGFTEQTMYYIFNHEFTTPTDQSTLEIPVVLRRLVSRHIISGYGISGDLNQLPGSSYEDKYYESLLQEDHPLGLGKQLFSGRESIMGKAFYNQLVYDFIFPSVFLLEKENRSETLQTWLEEHEQKCWDMYEADGKSREQIERSWNGNKTYCYWYDNPMDKEQPKVLVALLEALISNKDNCVDKVLDAMKTADLKKVIKNETGGAGWLPTGTGMYTQLHNKLVANLKDVVKNNPLAPWKPDIEFDVQLKDVPKTIGFDLATITPQTPAQSKVTTQIGENGEPNLTFLLLGTKDQKYSFGCNQLTTESGVMLPQEELPGTHLLPNVSTTYKVSIDGELTLNGSTGEKATVYISYQTMIETLQKMNLTGSYDVDKWRKNESSSSFCPFYASALLHIPNLNYNTLENNLLGQISSLSDHQFYFEVPIPDFSKISSGEARWIVESSTGSAN